MELGRVGAIRPPENLHEIHFGHLASSNEHGLEEGEQMRSLSGTNCSFDPLAKAGSDLAFARLGV